MEHEKNHAPEQEHEDERREKSNTQTIIQWVIIGVLAVLIIYNGVKIYSADVVNPISGNNVATGIGTVSAAEILPTGVPDIYGKELGISYDDVSASNQNLAQETINKLASYEETQLDNATLQRYVRIGSSIACEYCCGAQTLVFSDGSKACGCAHSAAMRGLAKYLLTKHPEMTDLQILNELGKWKVLFFPGPEQIKAGALKANNIDFASNKSVEYVIIASNYYRGLENQAAASSGGGTSSGGGQVGSCVTKG